MRLGFWVCYLPDSSVIFESTDVPVIGGLTLDWHLFGVGLCTAARTRIASEGEGGFAGCATSTVCEEMYLYAISKDGKTKCWNPIHQNSFKTGELLMPNQSVWIV